MTFWLPLKTKNAKLIGNCMVIVALLLFIQIFEPTSLWCRLDLFGGQITLLLVNLGLFIHQITLIWSTIRYNRFLRARFSSLDSLVLDHRIWDNVQELNDIKLRIRW